MDVNSETQNVTFDIPWDSVMGAAKQLPSVISPHRFHLHHLLPHRLHPPQTPGLVGALVFIDKLDPWANSFLELLQR